MDLFRQFAIILVFVVLASGAVADDKSVRLAAPVGLVENGFLRFLLPRFSLKTQVRVELVSPGDPADAALGAAGTPVFSGGNTNWALEILSPDHTGTVRFADWLQSNAGQRAITGFQIDGVAVFALPVEEVEVTAVEVVEGDPVAGKSLSRQHCGRCHVAIAGETMLGIGSTPSFFVLRAFEDWAYRFQAFYVLNPHPAFTQVTDVTPPFPIDRPSPIVPIELTIEEIEAIYAYVAGIEPADLGAPLVHQ